MAHENWQILAALLAAHFLGDFWFQPDWMYAYKRQAWCLFLHSLVHAGLV